jgi:hypothetical protein
MLRLGRCDISPIGRCSSLSQRLIWAVCKFEIDSQSNVDTDNISVLDDPAPWVDWWLFGPSVRGFAGVHSCLTNVINVSFICPDSMHACSVRPPAPNQTLCYSFSAGMLVHATSVFPFRGSGSSAMESQQASNHDHHLCRHLSCPSLDASWARYLPQAVICLVCA